MKAIIKQLEKKRLLTVIFLAFLSICAKAQFEQTPPFTPWPMTGTMAGFTNITTLPLHVHAQASGGSFNAVYIGHGNYVHWMNTAIGQGSLATLSPSIAVDAYGNTGLGYNTLNQNFSGKDNTAIGTISQEFLLGSNNTGVGYLSLHSNFTTVSGQQVPLVTNTGKNNTAVGMQSMSSIESGDDNSAFGYNALGANHNTSFNTALGRWSMANYTTSVSGNEAYNVSIGANCLENFVSGNFNVVSGGRGMHGLLSGSNNVVSGFRGLYSLTSGSDNIALGLNSMQAINTGSFNVGIGTNAIVKDVTNNQLSIQNVIWGKDMVEAYDGNGFTTAHVGIGTNLISNVPTASFDINGNARIRHIDQATDDHILTADEAGFVHYRPIGDFPGICTWSLGSLSPQNVHTGNGNACKNGFASVGIDDAGASALLSNATAKLYVYKDKRDKDGYYTIGTYSQGKEETRGVGVMGYGNSKTEGIGVYGMTNFVCDKVEDIKRNIAVYGGPNVNGWKDEDCVSPHGFWASYFAGPQIAINDPILISDARLKKDVEEINNADEIISKLSPKTYFFRHDVEKGFVFTDKRQYGFISQEVEKVLPELVHDVPGPVTPDEKGNLVASKETYKGLAYDELIAVLVKAVQNQNEKISELQAQVNNLTQGNTTAKTNSQTIMLGDDNVQQVVLYQNVPNPFSEKTTIAYQVPANAKDAEIRFYNQTGYLIKAAQLFSKGKGTVEVFGNGVAAGVYTYVLYVDGKVVANKKMVKQ